MQLNTQNLGKVSVTVDEGYWDINKEYARLTIVEVKDKFATYISRKYVPEGIEITDKEYWMPFSSLSESIILDYNLFVKEYKDKLAQLVKDLDGFTDRVDNLEDIQDDLKRATCTNTNLAKEVANLRRDTQKVLCQTDCILKRLNLYIENLGFTQIGDGLIVRDETLFVKHITQTELKKLLSN